MTALAWPLPLPPGEALFVPDVTPGHDRVLPAGRPLSAAWANGMLTGALVLVHDPSLSPRFHAIKLSHVLGKVKPIRPSLTSASPRSLREGSVHGPYGLAGCSPTPSRPPGRRRRHTAAPSSPRPGPSSSTDSPRPGRPHSPHSSRPAPPVLAAPITEAGRLGGVTRLAAFYTPGGLAPMGPSRDAGVCDVRFSWRGHVTGRASGRIVT
jgi:hypothetical protein